jgi:hypothetical protein
VTFALWSMECSSSLVVARVRIGPAANTSNPLNVFDLDTTS